MSDTYVLLRYGKRTGKIDTALTNEIGTAMLQLWALQNTTKSKECVIIHIQTGNILYRTCGTPNGFPEVEDWTGQKSMPIIKCEDIGIPREALKELV